MEGKAFAKLIRDSGLIDKIFTSPDVDITFSKVREGKTDRKISFDKFLFALEIIA